MESRPTTQNIGITETAERAGMFAHSAADNQGNFSSADWALFFGVSLLWGASFLLIAEALEAFTPGVVTLGRVGLGAITLMIIRAAREPGRRIEAEDRARVTLLAVVWVAVPFTLFPLAQQWINSAVTGLLNGATPLFVAVVSIFFVKVAPRGMQAFGLIAGFVGIVLISFGSAGQGSSEAGGVALVLLAAVCYGFAINLAPPLQAKYGAVVLMSSALSIATVLTVPYAVIDWSGTVWETEAALAMLVLGSLGTGIAYWIFAALVGRVGSIRASFITYLIPVVSLLLGMWIRDDAVTNLALIGTPITLGGAMLSSRSSA